MSTEAWTDYEVPGSPFFVLVDGAGGRRIGEGVANHVEPGGRAGAAGRARRCRTWSTPPAGRRRAAWTDRPASGGQRAELPAAGILPGDPSLYPRSLADVFGPPDAAPAGRTAAGRSGGLRWPRIGAHGIDGRLPDGFEGRIFVRPAPAEGGPIPVAQFATFPLPDDVGDFGGGAVTLMGPTDIFAVLFEYGPESVGTGSSPARGCPGALTAGDFQPYRAAPRASRGQSGTQWFFTEAGRPFTLYVVLGSHALRPSLVPRVNDAPRPASPVEPAPAPSGRGAPQWN